MKSFKIALAQFSPHIGNLEANAQKMLEQANEAKKQNADLIIFPELSSIGYPAEDLLLRPSLTKRTQQVFEQLKTVKDIVMVFGFVNQTEDGQRYNVTVVKPRPDGTLDMDRMLEHVDKNTILVACMMVNNEVGTRNDVERLAAEVKRRNSRTIVHVDAVQAWMRVPIKLDNIDTLSVSGHKIHAPKGIGALYLSDRLVQAFRPPYLGGEQERGLRPGTENLPYAMGLAAAATRLAKTMKSRDTAMRALNQRLREGLKAFPEVEINSPENAVPEVLNFSENCIKSETMLAWLAEAQIYVSSASACGRGQPSHTLAAMGKDPLAIDTAIRVSFCGDNTPEDVDAFLNRFEDGMKSLQRIRK